MDIQTLLVKEASSRKRTRLYATLEGNSMMNRIGRLVLMPDIYIPYLVTRFLDIDFGDAVGKTFWGRKLTVPSKDLDAFYLYHFGTLLGPEFKLIRYLIKNIKDGDVFYDIGANYGFYTMLVDSILTKGEVHAFEPIEKVFRYLSTNISTSHKDLTKKVFLNQVALSDKPGFINIYDANVSMHSGASSLIRETLLERNEAFNIVGVQATTLDNYMLQHTRPTFIKLDVEGAEAMVLSGGIKLLRDATPIIIIEVWDDTLGKKFSLSSVAILENAGYMAHSITEDGDLRKITPDKLFESADNLVFLKQR